MKNAMNILELLNRVAPISYKKLGKWNSMYKANSNVENKSKTKDELIPICIVLFIELFKLVELNKFNTFFMFFIICNILLCANVNYIISYF